MKIWGDFHDLILPFWLEKQLSTNTLTYGQLGVVGVVVVVVVVVVVTTHHISANNEPI